MKQLLLTLTIVLFTSCAFAAKTVDIRTLGSILKSRNNIQVSGNHPLTFVYGGEDISRQISSSSARAFA